MIPMRIRSPSLVWPRLMRFPLLRRSPRFHCGIIPSLPSPPSLPPSFNTPLIPMLQTAGRASSPNLTSCCYTNLLMFGLLIAFRPCFLCVQPAHDPTLDNEFMPISSSSPTLPKKLRGCLFLRLICFCNPKSFLDPRWLVTCLPLFSRGLVSFV
jgi:hypothetical protein